MEKEKFLNFANKNELNHAALKAIVLFESHHCLECRNGSPLAHSISEYGYLSGVESEFGFFKKIVICTNCLSFVKRKYNFLKFRYEYCTNYK